MSKKKLSFKDLILFLVGFLGVSITALCIGFFVLPLVLDSSQNSTVSVEQVDTTPPAPQKEEVKAKEPPPPPKPKQPERPLEDLLNAKTGYEKEVEAGQDLDTNALQSELDGLNFDGLDSDSDDDDDDLAALNEDPQTAAAPGFANFDDDGLDDDDDDDIDLR